MLSSEFESMTAIYRLAPDFAPKPIAWGIYETIPDTHFFIREFRDMLPDMPDLDKFAARLLAFYQNSKSLNGKFGFHVTTYAGNLPQYCLGRQLGNLLLEEYEAGPRFGD